MTEGENIFQNDTERLLILVFIVMITLMVPGCPFSGNIKKVSDMSPKEKAAWMLSMYNAQYKDYQERASKVPIPESEKIVLRAKKNVLKKVYPLIKMYCAYIETGSLPTDNVEDNISKLLNRLLKM